MKTTRRRVFGKLFGWLGESEKRQSYALMRSYFDADAYVQTYPDIAAAGIDPVLHYLDFGWREGREAVRWFDPRTYAKVEDIDPRTENAFLHLLLAASKEGVNPQIYYARLISSIVPGEKSQREAKVALKESNGRKTMKRKFSAGPMAGEIKSITLIPPARELMELVAKSFDAPYYLHTYPDVAESGVDPLLHFMTIGWIEGRDPNPDFSTSYYLHHNDDIRKAGINPYEHYLRVRGKETWRRVASVEGARVLRLFEKGGKLEAVVDEAMTVDPMVGFPRGSRCNTSPLLSLSQLTDRVEELRVEIGRQRYDYVVTVPHIRMSGAARVGAIFSTMLERLVDPSRILVLITDSSEVPYEHWFPRDVRRFDMTEKLDGLPELHRIQVLMDVLRGVACKSVVNINSRLAWETLRRFGRQMSHDFQVVTYFFTWDETKDGLRGGYPIQWLRDTADYHDVLLTDTQALAIDMRTRMGYPEDQVAALYTPVAPPGAEAVPPEPDETPRFLWAGRFDQQKRVDILVAIARANPRVQIDVFGKAVLDSKGLESYDPPENIVAKGTYSDLSEVLDTRYHGFLYTAQWDGIPTILLDIGHAGLPIVAPRVGGIDEVIDQTTGWLIDDFTDVDGYSAAIREMLSKPEEAQSRAAALKMRLEEQFAEQRYCDQLREILKLDGD